MNTHRNVSRAKLVRAVSFGVLAPVAATAPVAVPASGIFAPNAGPWG